MKKNWKILSALLVTAMLGTLLAGCGGTEREGESENVGNEVAGVEDEDGEEVQKVIWAFRSDAQEDDEKVFEEMNKLLRERYHLELEPIVISGGEYDDRMRLMSTGDEAYDLCFTSNWSNDFYGNVAREAFLPLDDLLETEAAKLLVEALPSENHTDVAKMNGHIYAVPNYQKCYQQYAVYIQKDLADKYNLDVDSIQGIRDLEPFMEQIRDNEQDIWPLCESNNAQQLLNYKGADFTFAGLGVFGGYDAFGSNGVVHVMLDDENYEAVSRLDNPYYVENFRVLNDYYKRGFLRNDLATVVDNTADLAANRYAISIGMAVLDNEITLSQQRGKEYIQIPFAEPYKFYNSGVDTMTAINANSENPEAAIKLLGVMWTDKEIFNMLVFGLEGEHYTKVGENKVELIEDSGYDRSSLAWSFGNQFQAYEMMGQRDGIWEETAVLNAQAEPSHLAGFNNDLTSVETESAQVSSVVTEYTTQLICAEDFDACLEEYREKLKAAGIDKVVEVTQKNINEWRAENGK